MTQKGDGVVQNLGQMMRVSDDESVSSSNKKRSDRTEERSARVKELKVKLQQRHGSDYSAVQYTLWAEMLVGETLASYPGHVGGGKSGLVSTVCACVNDSGNLPRTSPIMDKLHVVVMRRNNQTRYTARDGFHYQRHKG